MTRSMVLRFARAVLVVIALALLSNALAQTLQYQFPRGWLRIEGNTLTFCVSNQSPFVELDRSIAREIARTMGVNARFYDYHEGLEEGKAVTMRRQEFVILLTDVCDVFMGLPRSINATFDYPADEQQLSTRPYLQVEYVLVSTNPELTSIRGLEPGTPVALEYASLPLMFLATVRPDLERLTFDRTVGAEQQLDAILAGDAEVGIVWAPSLYDRFPNPSEAGLNVHAIDDLPNMRWLLVGGINRERGALRRQIDQAIVRLIQNGTIDELLAEFELDNEFFAAGPVAYEAVEGDDDFDDDDDEELEGIDFADYGYDVPGQTDDADDDDDDD